MAVSGPGHSRAMRRAATMYRQSWGVVGRGGGGSPAVRGGLPLLGAQRDFPQPLVCGDLPGPLGPLGKAIHRPAKAQVTAAEGEQHVQGLALPRAPDVGVLRLVLPGVRAGARVVRGGGGGGGRSQRGGGSRCRVLPSGRFVRGSAWWKGCSVCCT